MKIALTLYFIIASFSLTTLAQTPYEDSEAYAVYSAILFKEWPVTQAKATRLVIRIETGDYPHFGGESSIDTCLIPEKEDAAVVKPLIESYKEANKTPLLLQRKFTTDLEYVLVSKTQIKAFFDKNGIGGWEDFYKQYPHSGGINEVSAVGFNADKTMAIVYVGHSCGGLCGGGTYHIMQKSGDRWIQAKWRGGSCSWAS